MLWSFTFTFAFIALYMNIINPILYYRGIRSIIEFKLYFMVIQNLDPFNFEPKIRSYNVPQLCRIFENFAHKITK